MMHREFPLFVISVFWHWGLMAAALGSLWCGTLRADDPKPESDGSRAANSDVERVMREFQGRGDLGDGSAPLSPSETMQTFELSPDLRIELVAAEPQVMQPVYLSFDERGRMWVVQYLQYPFPEGLKVVKYDQYLRAVFDKTPAPPPHHLPGKDKITVFEDRDGDGKFDHAEDVITGLNITTAALSGYGGLWVLNPPYLLFYPDQDGDGRPEQTPQVKLRGFGIEDTHAVANSLAWGPDGWLYGAMGSTTTARIVSGANSDVAFEGQCLWRYHPRTEIFEVFAEGGGNTFSLEFDGAGRAFSGTNVGDSRGMFYPQGAYGEKNFGKHGPLTNPAAFGFINHMRHEGDRARFPQTFVIYEGGTLPPRYQGAVVAANALHHRVWLSRLHADGSTYRTTDDPVICTSSDHWFRPVDLKVGPDGAIYLADWYDERLTHVDPRDNWHKTSGRIYRIQGAKAHPDWPTDLSKLSLDELVTTLDHPNKWHRQTAVRLLSERLSRQTESPEKSKAVAELRELLVQDDSRTLGALWVLHQAELLDEAAYGKLLQHPQDDVRRWSVRLLGDQRQVSAETASALAALAAAEPDVQVRSQLASTAKRLSTVAALPIVKALLCHDEDASDPHLPLLLWWALETHCATGTPRPDPHLGVPLTTENSVPSFALVLQMFEDQSLWSHPLPRDAIASRLMRRFAQEALQQLAHPDQAVTAFEACDRLLTMTPADIHPRLMAGLLEAGQGRDLAQLPARLRQSILDYQQSLGDLDLVLGTRIGQPEAVAAALKVIGDEQGDLSLRLTLINLLGTEQTQKAVPTLLKLLRSPSSGVKIATLHALAQFSDPKIGQQIAAACRSTLSEEHGLRESALRVLAGRSEWSPFLMNDIADGRLRPAEVPPDVIQTLRYRASPEQQTELDRLFGPASDSTLQKQQEVQRVRQILAARSAKKKASQDELTAGRQLFKTHCATCHMLFNEGATIGPNLTGYERSNLDFLLTAIVDPSAGIREEFIQFQIATIDGRVLTGVLTDRNSSTVQLRDASNHLTTIPRTEIEELQAMKTSLMPDGILKRLNDEEVAALFAYLMQP